MTPITSSQVGKYAIYGIWGKLHPHKNMARQVRTTKYDAPSENMAPITSSQVGKYVFYSMGQITSSQNMARQVRTTKYMARPVRTGNYGANYILTGR